MAFRGHAAQTRLASFARAISRKSCAGLFIAGAIALGGCGHGGDGVASLAVDPGRFEGFHCKDLVGQWNSLVGREKQLRNLIDKASEGGGGTATCVEPVEKRCQAP